MAHCNYKLIYIVLVRKGGSLFFYLVVFTYVSSQVDKVWGQTPSTLTNDQVQQFVQQAQASGMTEPQMEELAKTRGFTAVDITAMRQRIRQLQPSSEKVEHVGKATPLREQPPTPAPPPVTKSSAVFGASLFTNTSLSFEPNLRLATPRNYIVGPDDELIINVYGNAQQTYRPRVTPEGTIFVENLSPVYVNGLTIEQAERRIITRLRTLYQGLNTTGGGINAQLTLGSVRSIKVTLIGQIVRPGTYTLSSLSTVFNALYAAGGPDPDRGSFRSINVLRGNRVIRTLDVYDFLLRADQRDNIRLQDQDLIFINHYDNRIELGGEVKQPGLYEVRPGETLRQALNFAGGLAERAYIATITLQRNTPTDQQLISIAAADIDQFMPKAGDRYVVGTISGRVINKVRISGAVFRPGDYALSQNMTVRQLVNTAEGLREDAFLHRASIRRLRDNLDPELISVDVGKLMRNEVADVLLQRDDELIIRSSSELREQRTVTVQGAVNKAGSFDFADSMTVANLIVLAGGFAESASSSRLEIARRVKDDTVGLEKNQSVQLIVCDIDPQLRLTNADARLLLRPFDQVFVRNSPRYEVQKGVVITGEVVYPGPYAIRQKNDRITDLIGRAGGLRPEAFLQAARFSRKGEPISLDLRRVMHYPDSGGNLLLEDGDVLTIPRKIELIRIRGEVLNPATVEFRPGKSTRRYIDEAGGFTRKALKGKTYLVGANGKIQPAHCFLGIRSYPRPDRGTEIVVPTELTKEPNRSSPAERVALLSVMASGAAVLLSAIRLFSN
jgi:protein involved in polysaccharide export with SLBB domain